MKRLALIVPAILPLLFAGCGGGGGGGAGVRVAVYVAGTGNDVTGDGTQTNPYRTITKALTDPEVSTLLKIRVGSGVYNAAAGETFPLVIPANVDLEGTAATAADAQIVGDTGNATVVQLQLGSSLNKVKVESASTAASARAVLIGAGSTASPTEVINCIIVGAGAAGRHGIAVLANNVVFSITGSSLSAPNAACIAISGTNAVGTITGNTFADCDYGVHLASTATSSTATIRTNTFNANAQAGINVEGGSVDAGTATSAGGNTFTGSLLYHLRDARSGGSIMQARGNTFNPAAQCGTNVFAEAGAPGWDIGTVCESAVYVDPNVATSGDGSAANPYKTIGEALNDGRVPGLPIFLKAGVYSAASGETFPIDVGDDVTIVGGATPSSVIVTGGATDPTVFLISGDRVTLRGFRAVSPYTGGSAARVVLIRGNDAALEQMLIAGTGSTSPPPNAVEADQAGLTFTIENCTLSAQSAAGLFINADVTVAVTGTTFTGSTNGIIVAGPGDAQSVTVRGCTFENTTGAAIQVLKGVVDAGTTSDPGDNTFSNCAIDLDDSRPSGARLQAIDNTFTDNPPVCGVNIVVAGAADGWHWRVTGGAEGNCPP
ncbi:MAG: DUF1565 domain-containing protein [Fimbriimonadia bacterium]|jgi:hypothetical protein